MAGVKNYPLISVTIGISLVVHLVILVIIPPFSSARHYEYTLRDLNFLVDELKSQETPLAKSTPPPSEPAPELKSEPITEIDKPLQTADNQIKTDSQTKPEEVAIPRLTDKNEISKTRKQPESTPDSKLTPEQARQKLNEIENLYKKNNISLESRLKSAERNKPYLVRIREQIQSKYYIPEEAKMQNMKGKVTLKIKVNRKGELMDVEVAKHSDFPILDMAAITSVKEAAPFPDISDKVDLDYLIIQVPFIYP